MASQGELTALVAAVAEKRDRAAFERLFDYFAPRLNAYLQRLGSDAGTAEDIAQESLAVLWRKAALFDAQKSSLATWLYRIARNRRIDALRREKIDFLDIDSVEEPAEASDIDNTIDRQKNGDAIREALTALPEEQLSLVRLAFFEGLSHNQISEKTHIPLGTVKSRIRLAFTRLRRKLESGGMTTVE